MVVLCGALLCAAPRVATAEDAAVEKARVHLRAGVANYEEGRFAEAASEMERAYAFQPVAELQYNVARCYERLGKLNDAIKYYERYLASTKDGSDRDSIGKHVQELRERAHAQAEGRQSPPPIDERVVWKTLIVYRALPPPPGRAARGAAYGLWALGAAAVATGVAFAVLTAQAGNDVQAQGSLTAPPVFDGDLRSKQDAAHLYPIGTGVGFGLGGVAIGGGIGLYVAARKLDHEAAKQRATEQALIPSVAPFYARSGASTIAGVAVAGRF